MPKEISLAKDLVGQIVTQENVQIGLRVEASKNWQYGGQGDYGLGTITAIIDGAEEYGLDYNYVTIMWDNDDENQYPLNEECLIFSNGKKKKSLISKFAEKHKVWDVFKVLSVENINGLEKGTIFQVIEIKNRVITVETSTQEGPYLISLDNPSLERLKYKKQTDIEKKTVQLIDDFAEIIQTPQYPKDVVINHFKARFKDLKEVYRIFNMFNQMEKLSKISSIASEAGLSAENRLYFESIFGRVELERTNRFAFIIRSENIRSYIRREIDSVVKKTYSEWNEFFKSIDGKTIFNQKLKNVIMQSNCNEKLKQYFTDGLGSTDENFIDFDRASKKIEFTPKGKQVRINDNGVINSVKQTMSPHKYFGKYFKGVEGVSEYDIKCFADEVISTYGEYRIMEIEDGKIGEFYNGLKTITSCMTGKSKTLFRLYDEHPNIFKMFAITLNGEIVGRALRVNAKTADKHEDFVYFDRLYFGGNEEVVQWFNSYCDSNGFTRKYKNSASDIDTFYNKKLGGAFNKRIYAEIFKKEDKDFEHHYQKIPYLDTLRYGMLGVLTNGTGELTVKDRFKQVPIRYVFDRSDSEYGGKGYKGYCAYQRSWTTDDVIEITDGDENYVGRTVATRYTKKTEKGYAVNH